MAAAVLTGGAVPADAEAGAVITMTDGFEFAPRAIAIRAGEAVVWQNTSRFKHTVTADPSRGSAELPPGAAPFASEELPPGASFRQVLTVPGTYRFFCTPHEGIGMTGTITVLSR